MNEPMRTAAVQYKPPKGDIPAAREQLADLARVAAVGADLVVLPEMAVTGYVFPNAESARVVAEDPEGPTFRVLSTVARESATWIVAGFPERAGDELYNSAWIIDPAGQLESVYRKTMLFEADLTWATPGDSGYHRVETERGTFGVGICMDLNDDSFIQWCSDANIDALAFPTNWIETGEARFHVWDYWAWRIDQTGVALIAANTYGPEGDVVFCGQSLILRDRKVLASAPGTGDAIIRAEL
jgi:predicted amidohydrolase